MEGGDGITSKSPHNESSQWTKDTVRRVVEDLVYNMSRIEKNQQANISMGKGAKELSGHSSNDEGYMVSVSVPFLLGW